MGVVDGCRRVPLHFRLRCREICTVECVIAYLCWSWSEVLFWIDEWSIAFDHQWLLVFRLRPLNTHGVPFSCTFLVHTSFPRHGIAVLADAADAAAVVANSFPKMFLSVCQDVLPRMSALSCY